MNLSEHFTKKEFEHSNTAKKNKIDNRISEGFIDNARRTCELAEIVRKVLTRPCKFNSGYRSLQLNKVILGSSNTSAHCFACAADIRMDKTEQEKIKDYFIQHKDAIEFDQLILYHKRRQRFVHIGVTKDPTNKGRKEILYAKKGGSYEYIKS